jgi:phosphoribosylamine---glycine ligase
MRAAAAGHEVKLFRYSKKPTRYATGFSPLFTLVDDWKQHMGWVGRDGLVFLTANNRYVYDLDRYREMGFKNIFAPTVASAKLEIERSAGMQAMQAIGHEVPPYQTFSSLPDALEFARKSDRAWVHKPMGDEEDKSLTYVSEDPADMVGWLGRQIKKGKKVKGKVMLQEKVDALCELGVSGWMGPEGFLPEKFQACVEHKKLHDGEIGPATGEQGTLCQYYEQDKLAKEMLIPLEPMLRALGHRGDFSVGAMIGTDGKPHFLEFTARCGYPAWWIQAASHRGDPVQWMKDLLDGKDSLKVSFDPAIGVVMSQPHYPYETATPEQVEGVPIQGVEAVLSDVHLVEVMRGHGPGMKGGKVVDQPIYETAGEYVCVATSVGKSIEKARKKVYAVIDKVKYPDKIFRTDIGSKVIPKLAALKRFGYVTDLNP